MPNRGSRSTFTRVLSPLRSGRRTMGLWKWCLRRERRRFQHPRGVRNHKTKKVRIALAPLSAPSEVPLNLATCHKPLIL